MPAVVSDIGGCKEIIQRSGGGLITKAKDSYAFYENCKRLVEEEDIYNEKKKIGFKFAEEQKWDKINEKLIEEYINLVNESITKEMVWEKSLLEFSQNWI